MSAKENCDLALEIYRLSNEGEFDRILELTRPDVEVDAPALGQTFTGRPGFQSFLQTFTHAFPDLRITVVNQVADDTTVVNECTWTGTHNGPLMSANGPIQPTGRRVEGARFCEVWTIRDGALARLVNYQDLGTWLRQLGLA